MLVGFLGGGGGMVRLLKAVAHHTRDTLHTKLAEVYTLNRQYDDALESFHFAIRCCRVLLFYKTQKKEREREGICTVEKMKIRK